MNIDAINEILREEQPDQMSVKSYDGRDRRLVLSFVTNGGPRENYEFLVEFDQAIIFHLPSVLHGSIVFRYASEPERKHLVPPTSYDATELSGTPGAYTVVALDAANGVPLGYYIAAESVIADWRPLRTQQKRGRT